REFFLNQNNPANFENTWNTANYLYRRVGSVTKPVNFDTVMDFSVLKKIMADPLCANSKDEYSMRFTPKTVQAIKLESTEILTKVVMIHFYPNSWDLNKKVIKKVDDKDVEELYDPNVSFVLEEIAKLAGQYNRARIIVEGHSDSSMKGKVSDSLVKELSANRANSVKEALINKYKTLDPAQFSAVGMGWDVPADPNDPQNQAKNRRVEVKVYPLEAQ
ncbi:MAG: OmpA family protein, partial [Deltaproteobacteria bacterium]|nr:OmpA family protein [Deltaproteobacteria bacterium]